MGAFLRTQKGSIKGLFADLAGNQMGQNNDGHLAILIFSTSEDKTKFCLLYFSMFRTRIQSTCTKTCGLPTHAIEH